jgi:hypothetical protein
VFSCLAAVAIAGEDFRLPRGPEETTQPCHFSTPVGSAGKFATGCKSWDLRGFPPEEFRDKLVEGDVHLVTAE